jgi:translation elongation factor EF-Tu-like GTPase
MSVENSIKIMTMKYTEFRECINKLLDEYDEYITQPNTASRIEMEDSIDNLFEYLRKETHDN